MHHANAYLVKVLQVSKIDIDVKGVIKIDISHHSDGFAVVLKQEHLLFMTCMNPILALSYFSYMCDAWRARRVLICPFPWEVIQGHAI